MGIRLGVRRILGAQDAEQYPFSSCSWLMPTAVNIARRCRPLVAVPAACPTCLELTNGLARGLDPDHAGDPVREVMALLARMFIRSVAEVTDQQRAGRVTTPS